MRIDYDGLRAIAPRGRSQYLRALVKVFNAEARDWGITTRLDACHFISQWAHETDGFRTLEEYADGSAYNSRTDLGNRKNTNDGEVFKGRGFPMLTGRHNYRTAGRALNLPLESKPELAGHPENSVRIGMWYWKSRNISRYANRNDIRRVTRLINGGYNGLRDRQRYFQRAWAQYGKRKSMIRSKTRVAALGAGAFGGITKAASVLADLSDISYSLQDLGLLAITLISLIGLAVCVWIIWSERGLKAESFND